MIDGIKLYIKDNLFAKQIKQNPTFEFSRNVSETTGELGHKSIAKYRNLFVTVYDNGAIEIRGSAHKFWNHGKHNYNDYSLQDIFQTLTELTNLFGQQILSMFLQNLEIGLNINPPISTTKILEWLVLHKRSEIRKVTFNHSNYHEADHQRYYVKIYDKGMQYQLADNILRIETKYIKMIELNKMGIRTLADLLNIDMYPQLGDVLFSKWNEVLLIDQTIRKKDLTPIQRKKLYDYENPLYWLHLSKDEKSYRLNKEIVKYQKLINKYSDNIHGRISSRLSEKWQKLTKISVGVIDEKRQKLTDILENTPKPLPHKRLCKHFKEKAAKINLLYTELKFANDNQEQKKCKITGLDISMQKDDSILLSHTGLYYYKKYQPQTYIWIKEKFLTDFWRDVDLKTEIKEIAHNIRHYNDRYNRKHPPGQGWLF